jgi:hypothetical protein
MCGKLSDDKLLLIQNRAFFAMPNDRQIALRAELKSWFANVIEKRDPSHQGRGGCARGC